MGRYRLQAARCRRRHRRGRDRRLARQGRRRHRRGPAARRRDDRQGDGRDDLAGRRQGRRAARRARRDGAGRRAAGRARSRRRGQREGRRTAPAPKPKRRSLPHPSRSRSRSADAAGAEAAPLRRAEDRASRARAAFTTRAAGDKPLASPAVRAARARTRHRAAIRARHGPGGPHQPRRSRRLSSRRGGRSVSRPRAAATRSATASRR